MLPTSRLALTNNDNHACTGVFGSRHVHVDCDVSLEIYRVNRLPEARTEAVQLSVSRWLQSAPGSIDKTHPAEPLYLCARSNEWRMADIQGALAVQFSDASLRVSDMLQGRGKLLLHLAVMLAISSPLVIPYLAATIASWTVYLRGLQFFILIVGLSGCVICLTPLMLMRKNRLAVYQYVRHHFRYPTPSHSQ